MAQDPCAFNFIYTNYSDEKALFSNFRHLQEHLNRIGCGSTTEEAEVILAANNSSNAAKERADVICDGADDDVEIQAAYNQILDTGGRIILQDGDYYLGETVNMSGQVGHIVFQGSGKATIHATATISTLNGNRWMFQSLDNITPVGDLTLSFEGLVFDGDDVANSCAIIVAGTTAHPHLRIEHNVFRSFKSRVFYANYNNNLSLYFKSNIIKDCALTDDDTAVGDKFGIQVQDGLSVWYIWFCDNFLYNVTLGSGTQGIVDFENNGGYAFVQRNITISCDTPVFRDLGTPQSVISNNWINGTYVLGDLTGGTGVVNNTIADAKGDILAASAADVWDNLTVGTNNFALFADSAQTLGLQWRNTDRTLNVNVTAVGNITTGEDDLMSYAVPAATLGATGDWVDFNAAGTFAATINNKRLRVKFGATTIFDSGSLAITAATDWSLEGQIIRTGATTQKCFVRLNTSSATLSAYADYSTAAETLANAITLKLTGEATDTNDVVEETLTVRFIPAP